MLLVDVVAAVCAALDGVAVTMSGRAPRPRLCHVTKWARFDGYGFNLHAEKARPGQFVGKVDAGSPAEAAGLREGDRIVEVNGVNISHENHKQVRLYSKPPLVRHALYLAKLTL